MTERFVSACATNSNTIVRGRSSTPTWRYTSTAEFDSSAFECCFCSGGAVDGCERSTTSDPSGSSSARCAGRCDGRSGRAAAGSAASASANHVRASAAPTLPWQSACRWTISSSCVRTKDTYASWVSAALWVYSK